MNYHYLRFAPEGQNYAGAVIYYLLPLMDMFFMISGLLIMLRYGDTLLDSRSSYRDFLVRRFARIYPVYLATLVFFVIVGLAINSGAAESGWEGRFNFAVLPQNLLLMQSWGLGGELTFNYVGWTLGAEWFCYLTLPVIVFIWLRAGVRGLIALAAVVIALLQWASTAGIIPDGFWLTSYAWGAFRAFADFTLGALIAVLARRSTLSWRSHAPAWISFALCIGLMLTQANAYLVLAMLALSIFLATVVERNNPSASNFLKPLSPVGQVSFGIYILHPVVEAIFLSVLWRRFLEPLEIMSFFTWWYVPMIVVVLLAMASDRWFERPASRWIVRVLGERKRPVSAAE